MTGISEKFFEMSSERMEKIRQSMAKYKDEIASHFRDMSVEVKDWRFAMEKTQEGHVIDASVKLLIKPKK